MARDAGLTVVEVTEADAELAAAMWEQAPALSLADRLCLSLGRRLDLTVATADAAWMGLENGPSVVLVR